MNRLALTLALGTLTIFGFTGCSSDTAEQTPSNNASANETPSAQTPETPSTPQVVGLSVGASPAPHAEILEFVKPLLLEEGVDLKIVEFTDYVLPNLSVDSGELDANYFQHIPYMTTFNESNGTDIVSVGAIHFEPLGIYAGNSASLDDIKNGGVEIAIPNDTVNEARALSLLESLDLIEVNPDAIETATPKDITSNPYDIKFIELEAAQIPRVLDDVDFGIINGNYALSGDVTDKVVITEDKDSYFAQLYGNIVSTNKDDANNLAILTLVEVLQSKEVSDFINNNYDGLVIPLN
ncbi:MAG: hypothetical protein ATN36_06860 [Epulopiscium sp. Nele67-Bin005]|nr:MAG: hypothetical protein ATN36_06860 [Epulopiscium sp. Nele67-Bin005]